MAAIGALALALVLGPLEFYVRATVRGRVSHYAYAGMDKPTISRLLKESGATRVKFISKEAYTKATERK